jgi:uncharacterized protein YjbI with pentapeptide repeats
MNMAKEEQLEVLKKDVAAWNQWRADNSSVAIDLQGANLKEANLEGANLERANLKEANLERANLKEANLVHTAIYDAKLMGANLEDANLGGAQLAGANLEGANLYSANLCGAYFEFANLEGANLLSADLERAFFLNANLQGANLSGAYMRWVNLHNANLLNADLEEAKLYQAVLLQTNLQEANLERATLTQTILVESNVEQAIFTGCSIYGLSVWNLQGTPKDQTNLIITRENEPAVMVDDLEVAQFIYLLLNNAKIRNVIDTIGRKGVLILGRFIAERKQVLDAIRHELRRLGYLPMVFDFDRPTDRDFTETIMTLGGMSLFVIADITNPKSSPLELQTTVPNYMIPFVPIIHEGERPFAMFKDLQGKFDWVLDTLEYDSESTLVQVLDKAVIRPALEKHEELVTRKLVDRQTKKAKDYL